MCNRTCMPAIVQQFKHEVGERLVAYVNMDTVVHSQDALYTRMHPLLARLLYTVTKALEQPDPAVQPPSRPPPHATIYDWTLYRHAQSNQIDEEGEPLCAAF